MSYPAEVRTARLVLARWRPEDREAFLDIWRDRSVWAALRPLAPYDPEAAVVRFEHHVAHWERHGFGLWAVREAGGDGSVAGWAGAAHPDPLPRDVEVGWTLREAFRGRGLATEAARAAVSAAFAALPVPRVVSLILPANAPSIAVARRLGMTRAGDVPHVGAGARVEVYELTRRRRSPPGRPGRGSP